MRVVAGTAGGRRLRAPEGRATRPTADRVREAMFNALGSLGALEGARVLDLFAGSGALGIEALSRGASEVVFVDVDGRALAVVGDNLTTTALVGGAVVRADALAFLRSGGGRFDLALLDPPYAFDSWDELLVLVDADVVVIESDRDVDLPARWQMHRSKRYGDTVVTIATRRSDVSCADPDAGDR